LKSIRLDAFILGNHEPVPPDSGRRSSGRPDRAPTGVDSRRQRANPTGQRASPLGQLHAGQRCQRRESRILWPFNKKCAWGPGSGRNPEECLPDLAGGGQRASRGRC
jgi:hypothetical protein